MPAAVATGHRASGGAACPATQCRAAAAQLAGGVVWAVGLCGMWLGSYTMALAAMEERIWRVVGAPVGGGKSVFGSHRRRGS